MPSTATGEEPVQPYAVILGEALIDLVETEVDGGPGYRALPGGGPFNVAVGLARLGAPVHYVGALSTDVLGRRLRAVLDDAGVDRTGCVATDTPTALAVTTFDGTVPDFHFYGAPPSYAQLGPDQLDPGLVAGATTVYCGSIALLAEPSAAAARAAWAIDGPLRTLDPNARPHLLDTAGGPTTGDLRATVADLAATADLVKLSDADARILYDLDPLPAAEHLRDRGARAVVVTLGPAGALVLPPSGQPRTVRAPRVEAVDTTGAGDAMMAALMHGLTTDGWPADDDGWAGLVRFATTAASLCCQAPGAAPAMPTLAAVHARLR